MQSKVSMVIPCYNKEKFIGGMFDSILAQEWDSIELILVDDGSTDSTRNIIAEYEPKFIARGYEVIIIDQENQGVSAAVRNGLMRITGEYVCQIDADDELDPRYASMMAGWLDENPGYDWVACDATVIAEKSDYYISSFPNGKLLDCTLEKWLLEKINRACWIYFIRTNYLVSCNVIEFFYTGREVNQEAQFFFPLKLGGGEIGYLCHTLYRYNRRDAATHRSYRGDYETSKVRWKGFTSALSNIIGSMPISYTDKTKLYAITEIWHSIRLIYDIWEDYTKKIDLQEAIDDLLRFVRAYFAPLSAIDIEAVYMNTLPFCAAVTDCIQDTKVTDIKKPSGRIIAWGTIGKNATTILELLRGSDLVPDELWDLAGDGIKVKKPNVADLKDDDLILVLPILNGDIITTLNKSNLKNVMTCDEIRSYIASTILPKFYNGTISFLPNQ